MTDRPTAIRYRAIRANTFDPLTLRNAQAFVVGGFIGFCISAVVTLAVIGAPISVTNFGLGIVSASLLPVTAIIFVSAVHIRNRQVGLRDAIGAKAVGVTGVASELGVAL